MANTEMSQHLYQYLCNKIGTEKVVKARREFFKANDCVANHKSSEIEYISSGSKSEGLDLQGSDIDIMLMDRTNVIHDECPDRKPILSRGHLLCVDTNNAPPGFARIKVHLPRYQIQNSYIYIQGIKVELLREVGNDFILPNTSLKHYLMHGVPPFYSSAFMTHGPSVSTCNESVDWVFCFRLDEWPGEALNWIYRTRLQDWPPENLITDIFQEEKSVLLVPIGSKFGAAEGNPLEWRISFSVAEQMLVHNFNHTQMICYAILKILLKQVLDKEAKDLLCSYFMKTLLFWLIEETGVSLWTPSNLFKCFKACILRLSYHIKYKYFPNYFIIQNNMFEGKKWGDSQPRLLYLLHDIYTEGINFTLRTETLQDFITLNTNNHICKETSMRSHEEDKAIFPLLQYQFFPQIPLTEIYYYLTTCQSNGKLIKSLFAIFFVTKSIKTAVETEYDINRTNKQCYGEYKSLLSNFLVGTNFNLNGWLTLAAFFYQHKQYYNTLKIIDFVCSQIKNKKNTQEPCLVFNNYTPTYQHTVCRGSSFLQRYKSVCVTPIPILTVGTVFDKSDFEPGLGFILIDESQCRFGHFMRFMCFHHLHDFAGRHRALCEFQQVVDNTNIAQITCMDTTNALFYLFRAYMTSNIEIPQRNLVTSINIIRLLFDNPVFCSVITSCPTFFNMH